MENKTGCFVPAYRKLRSFKWKTKLAVLKRHTCSFVAFYSNVPGESKMFTRLAGQGAGYGIKGIWLIIKTKTSIYQSKAKGQRPT